MTRASTRRDLGLIAVVFLLLSGVYALGVWLTVGAAGFPLDDAFIHLQFARNLVETGQMAFNPGVPSSGCTAPLFAWLLAGAFWVVRDWYAASYLVGALAALVGLALVHRIVLEWSGRREAAHWAGLIAACATPTVISAYSGMETPVYVAVLLLGIWLYGKSEALAARLAGSAVFAVSVWLRPEFLMIAPLIVAERLWARWGTGLWPVFSSGQAAGDREMKKDRSETGPPAHTRSETGPPAHARSETGPPAHTRSETGLPAHTRSETGPPVQSGIGLVAEVAWHVLIWTAILAAYVAYHWSQDGHLVPSTFRAKSVTTLVFAPPLVSGLPGAIERGDPLGIILAALVWPVVVWIGANIGLGVICLPLIFGTRHAADAIVRDALPGSAGRRLALMVFVAYPLLRGLIDPIWPFWFQFQRYYAHMTPLMIILVLGTQAQAGTLLDWKRWSWRGVPLAVQFRRALAWCLPFLVIRGAMAVLAVSNIDQMQVALGRWVADNTRADALVATNDIGAIAFVSRREILDTIGLVEPPIVEHYLAGGTLEAYLERRRPDVVIVFPNWYPALAANDAFETVHRAVLPINVICGGPEMVVYRPR